MKKRIRRHEILNQADKVIQTLQMPVEELRKVEKQAQIQFDQARNEYVTNRVRHRLASIGLSRFSELGIDAPIGTFRQIGIENLGQLAERIQKQSQILGIPKTELQNIVQVINRLEAPTESDRQLLSQTEFWSEADYRLFSAVACFQERNVSERDDPYLRVGLELLKISKKARRSASFIGWFSGITRGNAIDCLETLNGLNSDAYLDPAKASLKNLTEQLVNILDASFEGKKSFHSSWPSRATVVIALAEKMLFGTEKSIEAVPKKEFRIFPKPEPPQPIGSKFEIKEVKTAPHRIGDESSVPTALLNLIRATPLHLDGFRLDLRQYQHFGARFILAARRVILGDEMGLGKTIQALAVAQHLKNVNGQVSVLVIAPLAVLENWQKETRRSTNLNPYVIHGESRDGTARRWLKNGGIAITNYDSILKIDTLINQKIDLVIVDEASEIKNPLINRTTATLRMIQKSTYSVLMTGTPLVNRTSDFINLISYVNENVSAQLGKTFGDGSNAHAQPELFRKIVGGVYLRRTQKEVLTELKEPVIIDEFVSFPKQASVSYRSYIEMGNFMGARRALTLGDCSDSTKMARLRSLSESYLRENRKILVFSYFKEVLQDVKKNVFPDAIIIDGSCTKDFRDSAINRFNSDPIARILAMQIQVGAYGLNLQEASVVVMMEPQYVPSWEHQAIGRAQRFGQTRVVMVHRLICDVGVDQRVNQILDSKAKIMKLLSDTSELAQLSEESVSDKPFLQQKKVLAEERSRLGISAA
jgi:SNF2 family DNA or RNA helicase